MNKERHIAGVTLTPYFQTHHHHSPLAFSKHMSGGLASTDLDDDRFSYSPQDRFIRSSEAYHQMDSYDSMAPISQTTQSVIVPNEAIYGHHVESDVHYTSAISIKQHQVTSSDYLEEDECMNSIKNTTDFNLSVANQNGGVGCSSPFLLCLICGDKATGKHYGAHSCDGCKGFFRRSVRKNHNYCCRFNRSCIINKHKRNQCRFCRFRKCVRAGMKKEAVQNERDRISHRKVNFDEASDISISVTLLLKAEHYLRGFSPKSNTINLASMKIATVDDVCNSMRQQLMALVNWAQYFPVFNDLTQQDKISLLRARAGEHLLLGAAWRSISMDDVLLLGNNCIIPRDSTGLSTSSLSSLNQDKDQHVSKSISTPSVNSVANCENDSQTETRPNPVDFGPEIRKIGMRVMNELVRIFRETNIDENEYVCLKAIVFFDPTVKDINDIERVKAIRYGVQLILEEYITDRPLDSRGRFGQLLLALQVLHSITWQMVEQIQLADLLGNAHIDSLLKEMLLGDFHGLTCPPNPNLLVLPAPDSVSSELEPTTTINIMDTPKHEELEDLVQKELKQEVISPLSSPPTFTDIGSVPEEKFTIPNKDK